MKRIEHTVRTALATLLLAVLLALGGQAITNQTINNALAVSPPAAVSTQAAADNEATGATTSTGSAEQTAATQQQIGVVDARYAVQQTGPAVVTVVNTMQVTAGRNRFGNGGPGQTAEAYGSGVIIDEQGHIVTNQHVVEGQQSLEVIFADGTTATATLVGEDAYTDLAVIKVDVAVPAVAQFTDSDRLEPGQPVVAIGTALGDYENTVTAGIVSALHRQIDDANTSAQNLIQTDAAINQGNSGGPLLDLEGNVVGINTAVVRNDGTMGSVAEGLGFAIPSNTVKAIAEQLIDTGAASHPYVGISYQAITPEMAAVNNLAREQGIYVTEVAPGSPAGNAGIQPNSIITKFDGVALNTDTASTLVTLLSKHKVGDSVTLTLVAPGSNTETEVTVVLAERPAGQ